MNSPSGFLPRLINSISDLINYRASQARILFRDSDSAATESAEEALLRRRIRAAAVVLFVAKLAIMVRAFLLYGDFGTLNILSVLGLAAASAWLYNPRNASRFSLRVVETVIFLGVSVDTGMQLHDTLHELSTGTGIGGKESDGRAVLFVAAVKDQIIATFGMMMIYGMFIPNRPRRAALMVFLMAVAPGVVIGLNESSVAAIAMFRQEHLQSTRIFSGNLLALTVGAGCAIYGTAIVNRWRNRAIEAEQLGQYRLREKIGSGGMGDVYLAEHRLLKRVCAVKLIRADLSDDPIMLSRFEREVQATATLTHWNTVQVFDYGQTADGTFFYVMEHLHGRNLRQIVEEHGALPEERVVFVLRQVCDALREAASFGLVHRDIKPSNIFLANVGNRCDVAKLLDFGLVRPLAEVRDPDVSGANQIKGSPRYMCPEQAQGRSPDTRGDLYSLGATAYFLLTGQPPFNLQNPLELVIAHATKPPPTFREIQADVSPELERIVRRCLQKNPEDRYQTPDEILADLEALPACRMWTWQAAQEWWNERLSDIVPGMSSGGHDQNRETADVLEETIIEASHSGEFPNQVD